jgi:Domain of unknown function (DUF4258)
MFDKILKEFKDKIRANRYVMTIHAEEEMDDDGLTIFDVERGILTGIIVERQKDKKTGEWKYLVKGHTVHDMNVFVVAKLSPTGKMFIITVFKE